eukprot:GEMP01002908.1.p1 GENE.GEMP01002908.1~~GEMP01002908.1.p1  ORF type:complete len:471 (-),score=106.04 GEMP01002908.1:3045-4457(-)
MQVLYFLLLGVVNAAGDSTPNCEEPPAHAGTCVGEFRWIPALGRCECVPLFPLFTSVEPSYHPATGRVLQNTAKRYYFNGCYPGQQRGKMKIMTIGIFVDRGFYNKAGGEETKVRGAIQQMVRYANVLYEEQFAIRIRVAKLFLAKPGHSIPGGGRNNLWMDDIPNPQNGEACQPTGMVKGWQRLSAMMKWVAKHFGNQYGLWHLFTACRCEIRPNTNLSGGWADGKVCAEGTRAPGTRAAYTTWSTYPYRAVTFAHELGHNLGAWHTFSHGPEFPAESNKGVMDYHKYYWKGLVQFHSVHRKNMCKVIASSMATASRNPRRACWAEEDDADTATTTVVTDTTTTTVTTDTSTTTVITDPATTTVITDTATTTVTTDTSTTTADTTTAPNSGKAGTIIAIICGAFFVVGVILILWIWRKPGQVEPVPQQPQASKMKDKQNLKSGRKQQRKRTRTTPRSARKHKGNVEAQE